MASVDVCNVFCICVKASLAAQRYLMHELLRVQDVTTTTSSSATCAADAHATCVLDLPPPQRQQLLRALTRAVCVREKATLAYKQAGSSASHDLVTTADVLTQAVLLRALRRAYPHTPFTIVAEEDDEDDDEDDDEKHNNSEDGGSMAGGAHSPLSQHVTRCLATYYDTLTHVPHEHALRAHIARQAQQQQTQQQHNKDGSAVLHAHSVHELRTRLALYIDPIDGTGCFVDGAWEAPLTLVGVTLDGEPVAGVANRVFCYPATATTTTARTRVTCTHAHNNNSGSTSNRGVVMAAAAATATTSASCAADAIRDGGDGRGNDDDDNSNSVRSLSYVWHVPPTQLLPQQQQRQQRQQSDKDHTTTHCAHTTPFLVYEGSHIVCDAACLCSAAADAAVSLSPSRRMLTLCQSSTTRASVLRALQQQLAPVQVHLARGAGNKQLLLVRKMLLLQQQQQQQQAQQRQRQRQCMTQSSSSPSPSVSCAAAATAATAAATLAGCDVFVAPDKTLHKWDCCAPHAFVRALGGELYTHAGKALRYDVVSCNTTTTTTTTTTRASDAQQHRRACAAAAVREAQGSLPGGVIAVTREAKAEVARRMCWPRTHATPSSAPSSHDNDCSCAAAAATAAAAAAPACVQSSL